MKNLTISPTKKSLAVKCEKGRIEFHGCSITNDSKLFFDPILNWVKEYIREPEELTEVICRFDYIDTSSFKHVYNILKELSTLKKNKKKLIVQWYFDYGDHEILELGEILKGRLDLNIEFIQNGATFMSSPQAAK